MATYIETIYNGRKNSRTTTNIAKIQTHKEKYLSEQGYRIIEKRGKETKIRDNNTIRLEYLLLCENGTEYTIMGYRIVLIKEKNKNTIMESNIIEQEKPLSSDIPLEWLRRLSPLKPVADTLLLAEAEEELELLQKKFNFENIRYWKKVRKTADPQYNRRLWLRTCLTRLMVRLAFEQPGSVLSTDRGVRLEVTEPFKARYTTTTNASPTELQLKPHMEEWFVCPLTAQMERILTGEHPLSGLHLPSSFTP